MQCIAFVVLKRTNYPPLVTLNRFDKIPISIQKKLALQVIQVMWFPFLSPPDRWNVWIVNFEFRLRPLLMFVQLRTISVGMHHFICIYISIVNFELGFQSFFCPSHYEFLIILIIIIIRSSSSLLLSADHHHHIYILWRRFLPSPSFPRVTIISKITLINILKIKWWWCQYQ